MFYRHLFLICFFVLNPAENLSIIQETIFGEIFTDHIQSNTSKIYSYIVNSVECPMCFFLTPKEKLFLNDTEFYAGKVTWSDLINKTGWAHLNIDITNEITDVEKAYTSGFLEGFVTHKRINDFYKNIEGIYFANDDSSKWKRLAYTQLNSTVNWITESYINSKKIKKLDPSFLEWMHLFTIQIYGIVDGYKQAKIQFKDQADLVDLEPVDILLLSSNGDIEEIRNMFQCGQKEANRTECLEPLKTIHSRCSGFIRLTDDNIYTGHTTWATYSEMVRIIKYYNIPYKNATAAKLALSSYPGSITSNDDFILTSNNLAIMETTLNSIKNSLNRKWYLKNKKKFTEGSYFPDVFNVLRASYIAKNAKEWVQLMQDHKTSFYDLSSAQWMVVDYKNCCNSTSFFYVLENIPGLTMAKDMSAKLTQDLYWGSENKAYFTTIIAGLNANMPQTPEESPWFGNARNVTFATLYNPVNTIETMKHFMQFTVSDSTMQDFSISPRFDISLSKELKGGIDSKVVDTTLIENLKFWVKSGPSSINKKYFEWTKESNPENLPHFGHPKLWNFEWQLSDQYGLTPHRTIVFPKKSDLLKFN